MEPELPESGERLEFVPWSHDQDRSPVGLAARYWWVGVAAAAVLVAGLVAGWALATRHPSGTESRPSPSTVAAGPPVAPTLLDLPAAPAPVPTTRPLVSEADLRAEASVAPSSVAAAAESFVFAYFTVDPAGSSGTAVRPEELADPAVSTYVEWVSADEVTEVAPDHFLVTVRFRLVVLGDDVRREPPAAVLVELRNSAKGFVVGALPMLIEVPAVTPSLDQTGGTTVSGPGGVPVLAPDAVSQP